MNPVGSNGGTSYEYIEEGDSGVKFRRKFIHVPDKGSEKQAARERQRAATEFRRGLKAQGILLAEFKAPKHASSIVASDGSGTGFLISFGRFLSEENAIYRLAAPWPSKPVEFNLPYPRPIHSFTLDRSGNLLAVTPSRPQEGVEIFEARTGKSIRRLPISRFATSFIRDSSRLAILGRDVVHVVNVGSWELCARFQHLMRSE